jgi:pyruvate dehydrogenase E2 component (dihydrolipoamide acetyltransferase)
MSHEVTMPQLGFTMVEGTISEWRKREGDRVAKGEVLMEVTTEKVSIEIEAPFEGVIDRLLVPEGGTVPVGTPVCLLAGAGDLQAPSAPPSGESGGRDTVTVASAHPAGGNGHSIAASGEAGPRLRASGVAKRLARQHGLDLTALRLPGRGPQGRILGSDVLAYLQSVEQSAAALPPAPTGGRQPLVPASAGTPATAPPRVQTEPSARRIPFAGTRRLTGERMARSAREAPQVTLVIEVDATEAVKLREQLLSDWERADGVRLSPTDLIVRATALALREHPALNATLRGDEILLHDEVNVGIAVAVDDSLIVPVLHDAAGKPLRTIAAESRVLVDRARRGALSLDDVSGGTFTITNLGGYGIEMFTPIINPPEAAILGVGRVAERPAIHEGEICKRSLMHLSLTFDHRLVDGAPASQFLSRVKELLERPYLLLT